MVPDISPRKRGPPKNMPWKKSPRLIRKWAKLRLVRNIEWTNNSKISQFLEFAKLGIGNFGIV